MVLKIYLDFSSSCKNEELRLFCEFGQQDYFQILHHISIRWLSLRLAVKRLLKMWHPLKMYYLAKGEEQTYCIISKFVSSQEVEVNEHLLSVAEYFLYFVNSTLPIFCKAVKNLECDQPKCIRCHK